MGYCQDGRFMGGDVMSNYDAKREFRFYFSHRELSDLLYDATLEGLLKQARAALVAAYEEKVTQMKNQPLVLEDN